MKKNNDESLPGKDDFLMEPVLLTEEQSTEGKISAKEKKTAKKRLSAEERNAAGKPPSLEESFLQIEDIIAQMESQDVSLDESFTLYQQGIGKLKDCCRMLDEVEKKMLVLNAEGDLEEMP